MVTSVTPGHVFKRAIWTISCSGIMGRDHSISLSAEEAKRGWVMRGETRPTQIGRSTWASFHKVVGHSSGFIGKGQNLYFYILVALSIVEFSIHIWRYDRCPASNDCSAIDEIVQDRAEPNTPSRCCKNLGNLFLLSIGSNTEEFSRIFQFAFTADACHREKSLYNVFKNKSSGPLAAKRWITY